MSDAITGIGTQFQRKATGSWVSVANILSIGGPQPTRETIDTTTMDAVNGFKNFIAGLKDGGTASFEMLFTKASYNLMKDDFLTDSTVEYQILFPGELGFIGFRGFVVGLPLTIPLNDKVTASISIKVVGGLTLPATVTIAALLGVTVPEKGASPVSAITPSAQYTGGVTWNPVIANKFLASTVYTATIKLSALSAYTFNGVSANFFTVAGSSSDTNAVDSGIVVAVFPATGE